jgi:hypothetical protein
MMKEAWNSTTLGCNKVGKDTGYKIRGYKGNLKSRTGEREREEVRVSNYPLCRVVGS